MFGINKSTDQTNEIEIKILLVDDRPENLLALEAVLMPLNYVLIKANSGEEALRWVLKEEFALILLDVQMPGMDGFETAKFIKSREKTKNIPIIFITAISQALNYVNQGYSVGAIDYVFKPFNPDALRMKVEGFAKLYSSQKSLEKLAMDLKKAEEIARIISETSLDTIIITDAKGMILKVNPAVQIIFGYREQDCLERHFAKLLPGTRFFENSALKAGCFETEGYCKNKTTFPAEVYITEAKVDNEQLFVISIRDVSERKFIEQEKREHILESITDAFISLDSNWSFTFLNRAAEKFIAENDENLLGKSFWEKCPGMLSVKQRMERIFRDGAPDNFEHYCKIKLKWLEFNIYPFKEGISICFKDVTDIKHFEEELSRLDRLNLIGEMAAGIGHEIRNPLTTVRGFLQLLRSKNKSSDYYDLMIDELDRANSIITEFLSLAKNRKIDIKKCNLNTIVDAVSPLISADAYKSNKELIVETTQIPDLILNQNEIRQLLFNLCRNGLDAMDSPGTGKLKVKTFLDHDCIVLSVQDEGKGIDPDILKKIGTPFFTTKDNGTGLGLAICYSIAARHNATIKISSNRKGTTFNVQFKMQNDLYPQLCSTSQEA